MNKKIWIKLFAFIFIIGYFGIDSASASLDDGLIAYFPLDGNALDESGNGNDGIIHGANPTTDRFGNPDGAYRFNGVTDYIDIGNSSVFNIHDQITISLWVNAASLGGTFISKWKTESGWQGSWSMSLGGDGSVNFCVTGDGYSGQYIATSEDKIETDGFHHIAGVYNISDNTITIFVDGIENGTVSGQPGSIFVSNSKIYIGSSDYNITSGHRYSYFNGVIDDVRIYNRALSDYEINELAEIDNNNEPAASTSTGENGNDGGGGGCFVISLN